MVDEETIRIGSSEGESDVDNAPQAAVLQHQSRSRTVSSSSRSDSSVASLFDDGNDPVSQPSSVLTFVGGVQHTL